MMAIKKVAAWRTSDGELIDNVKYAHEREALRVIMDILKADGHTQTRAGEVAETIYDNRTKIMEVLKDV